VEVFTRFATQIGELRDRLGGLPAPVEAQDIWTGIWYEEAHHSTAIEGNTLVLKQVAILLAEGRAVGSRELREYNEVKRYADAADWIYRQAASPGSYQDGLLTA
jgi:Fic family protein